jgi:hypothetical protein
MHHEADDESGISSRPMAVIDVVGGHVARGEAMRNVLCVAIVLSAVTLSAGEDTAGQHRPEVREDWAFQHRYAVTADRAGKATLRNDRQPAPLVDEQAGTLKTDRDPTDQVARRTDALLAHLAQAHPGKADWAAFRKRLDPLLAEARAGAPDLTGKAPARQKTYLALCALRREIVLANPLLDFDRILFSDESNVGHMLTRTMNGQFNNLGCTEPGGSLWIIRDWKGAAPELVDLCKNAKVENGPRKGQALAGGTFHAPSLGFDGKTILFSWAPLYYKEGEQRGKDLRGGEKRRADPLRIFRIGVDGTDLRQITTDEGPWNDTEPCELPDGRIMFMSTRREVFDRCFAARPAFTLASMKPDGRDVLLLSRHETHEWLPSVANNGMILYSRWDYVDRRTAGSHGFWTCFPDGRDPRAPNGNYRDRIFDPRSPGYARYYPDSRSADRQPGAVGHVHAIPGSRKLMAVAGHPHEGVELGLVIRLDLERPDDYAGAPISAMTAGSWGGHGPWSAPWPLSEDFGRARLSGGALVLVGQGVGPVLVPQARALVERLQGHHRLGVVQVPPPSPALDPVGRHPAHRLHRAAAHVPAPLIGLAIEHHLRTRRHVLEQIVGRLPLGPTQPAPPVHELLEERVVSLVPQRVQHLPGPTLGLVILLRLILGRLLRLGSLPGLLRRGRLPGLHPRLPHVFAQVVQVQ